MMILALLSIGKIAIAILSVSLALFILFLGYRKLLNYFGKDQPNKEDYCVLYSLEDNPSIGTISFYFTAEKVRNVALHLLDEKYELVTVLSEKECTVGGNIIRFDSNTVPNGNYYYALITDNQKTVKKMAVHN
jgi:hypothetical protein